MPRSPRSFVESTATSKTSAATPSRTRNTLPSFFCNTRMSLSPMNAIVVGESRPETTGATERFGSMSAGAAKQGAAEKHAASKK